MYHSITIGDKNTWDDWKMIPVSRPVVAPPITATGPFCLQQARFFAGRHPEGLALECLDGDVLAVGHGQIGLKPKGIPHPVLLNVVVQELERVKAVGKGHDAVSVLLLDAPVHPDAPQIKERRVILQPHSGLCRDRVALCQRSGKILQRSGSYRGRKVLPPPLVRVQIKLPAPLPGLEHRVTRQALGEVGGSVSSGYVHREDLLHRGVTLAKSQTYPYEKAKELGLPAEEASYCPMMDEGMGKVDIGLIDNDLRYDVYEVRASTTTGAGTLNLYYQPAYL